MLATGEAIGHARFEWWPDWRGHCAAIVASGPSAKDANLAVLRNRVKVIAIKKTIELVPFADVVYGCDRAWWKHQRGLPQFNGLKLTWEGDNDHRPPEFADVYRIRIERKVDRILTATPGTIGSGGNSGFQAVNLAVQFGAARLLLIGFDMSDRSGVHWYGRNDWIKANNPDEHNFERWRKAFADSAQDFTALGIDVVYASPNGTLKCFRRNTVEQALAGWGL